MEAFLSKKQESLPLLLEQISPFDFYFHSFFKNYLIIQIMNRFVLVIAVGSALFFDEANAQWV